MGILPGSLIFGRTFPEQQNTFMNISALRLFAQQVSATKLTTPQAIVHHLGAVQAQDYAMSKWAVGIRLPGSAEADIDRAMTEGTILRTHVMRPTWHLVSAEDIHWMLELTAQNIRNSMKTRHKELELTPELLKKSNRIFEKALRDNHHLPREALMELLLKAGIPSNYNNRSSHLLAWAELEGLICSGAPQGNKQTYALLDERAKKKTTAFSREEALAELAKRYFTSHGPATLADFNWWSGLSVKDARNALESVKDQLLSQTIDGETYWLAPETAKHTAKKGTFLLPAFDEFIISYKNRSAALTKEQHAKAISTNGLFRPVIVSDSKVTGLWKRTVKNDTVLIETDYFEGVSADGKQSIEKAAARFGKFLGKGISGF